jgi:protein-S-isoprenylcysteine O-methyltransferase Ste14
MARNGALPDAEEVVFSPALVPLAMLIAAIAGLLQWFVPLGVLSDFERIEDIDPLWAVVVGGILAVCGLSLSIAGHLAMKRRLGDFVPWRPAGVLVTDGVYRWTRNPGYLGLWIALIGTALGLAFDWLLILTIPACIAVSLVVVRREELYLERKFGPQYLDYKIRVPRYFFIR